MLVARVAIARIADVSAAFAFASPMFLHAHQFAEGASQLGITRSLSNVVPMGLVEIASAGDQHQRTTALTEAGRAAMKNVHAPQPRTCEVGSGSTL